MSLSRLRVAVRQKFLVNASFLAILVLIIVTITWLYVSSERNFHWWIDWYNQAIEVATAFRESPSKAIQQVLLSLVDDRNQIYTLPLVPFLLTFGKSRLVYTLSLSLVYLLPFSLVMGGISARVIPAHSQTVFWSTALLTLLIPVSWVPTFMGIPDTGGALLIGLAVLVYLQDVKLKRWWQIPLIGFLIALAILLRRHFIYGGVAFLSAVTLQALIFFSVEVRQHPRRAWQFLLGYGTRIALIAAISLSTLLIVAWEFTQRALLSDYKTLYISWTLPLSDVLNLYTYFYGWATGLIVAIGFSAGILTRAVTLPAVSLIGLWGIFSLIIWLAVLRYGNVFYSLHVTPLVVIGLAAFIWTTWSRLAGKVRTLMLGMVGCYLVANLIIGLTPIGSFDSFFRPLFALSIQPLVRTDYDEVVRLVNYLRQLAPNKEPLYVVGYQRLQLNPSMVKAAERLLYEPESRILNILPAPQVDSRDDYPVETLLQAQYVVVPNPLPDYPLSPTKVPAVGEWLPNKEVDVIKVVFDAFTQNWEIAQDFKRLPVQFTLEGGAIVSVYQRTRPSSLETAVRTLYAMQQQIGERPGRQKDWITLSQLFNNASISKNPDDTYSLMTHPSYRDRAKGSATYFLYLGSLSEQAKVSGILNFLDSRCVGASLRFAMLDRQSNIINSIKTIHSPGDSSSFALSIQGKNAAYLLMDVLSYDTNNVIDYCSLSINQLSVSSQENDK
ncbi:hypothetical protein NDI49_10025 [Trichocoleus sp. ST-U3]|uniref:hypothetical protein n=1 Tax=Coleofasciculus sp. FACHB-542 TaxID=2692787 RepID=UPI0016830FEE|nr:hypothetical protein [Coleofasciculus sp. FACHB-542]MBD2085248.1 hypothetical protein [Coleofasciculus sp. FACHB-542]